MVKIPSSKNQYLFIGLIFLFQGFSINIDFFWDKLFQKYVYGYFHQLISLDGYNQK